MNSFREARKEDLGESVSEIVLCPVTTSFAEGSRWQFHDGDSSLTAVIEDPRFEKAVKRGTERFAKNDMLRVRLRTRQTRGADGLHIERAVVEVLDHLSGGVQLDVYA